MENNYFEEFEEMDNDDGMTVVACYPGKAAQVMQITGGLEGMQQFVGGCIEAVYPFSDPVAIVCNEEGKMNGMELNRALYTEDGTMYDIVAGPMFVCGLGEEDFASLQGELLEKYLEKYKQPETFIKIGNDILAIKLPEERQQQEKQTHKNNIHR
jgi:hypothetical protein